MINNKLIDINSLLDLKLPGLCDLPSVCAEVLNVDVPGVDNYKGVVWQPEILFRWALVGCPQDGTQTAISTPNIPNKYFASTSRDASLNNKPMRGSEINGGINE